MLDDHKKPVRIGHLFKLQGKEHVEVHETRARRDRRDSRRSTNSSSTASSTTRHELDSVRLSPLPLPKPMFGLAIELKNHADETKFSAAVHKLMAEDPCLIVERIAATNQTVMRGLGELHLRIVLEKPQGRHQHRTRHAARPRSRTRKRSRRGPTAITATRSRPAARASSARSTSRIEPLPGDHPEGFEFVNDTVGGTIPRQFMPAVEKGVRQVLSEGAIAGYPMTGVCGRVYDGKYHDVDSKEIAFITAGKRAFIDAVRKARPVLLEPYVLLEITAPSRYMGDIAGHLSTKRGRVQNSEVLAGDVCVVRAIAPLGELQNYANELKSMTGGAGTYTMEYSHGDPNRARPVAQFSCARSGVVHTPSTPAAVSSSRLAVGGGTGRV